MKKEKLTQFKYIKISQEIKGYILNGVWLEKEPIPSENKLCNIFKASRITIRKAIQNLVKKDLLYTIKGVGTFIVKKNNKQIAGNYSFSELIKLKGYSLKIKKINFKIINADSYISRYLGIKENTQIYFFERIYYGNDIPIIYSKSWFPIKRFKGLENFKLEDKSIYSILKQFYNLKIEREKSEFLAINNKNVQKILKTKNALLFSKTLMIELLKNKEQIFEYNESFINTNFISWYSS